MGMKKNNPGCGTSDCCGPCCRNVWNYLRDDYTDGELTLYGNELYGAIPYTYSAPFVETYVSGGVTYYQCTYQHSWNEWYGVDDYYAPADPRRIGIQGTVDPITGYDHYYSATGVFISVTACEPSPAINIIVVCEYAVYQTASPVSDLTTAGYTLDPTWGGSGDRYKKIDGDITHYVTQDNSDPNIWLISSTYDKTVTGAANLMSGFPSTITVTPAWNPFGMYSEFVFS